MVANRHATVAKLNRAIADVVNKFAELDVVKAWGDGSAVATDGTMVDTYLDNLLAETSIRYGGLGGIAYHYVSDSLHRSLFEIYPVWGVGGDLHHRRAAGQRLRRQAVDRSMPIPRGRASLSSRWRTCSGST